MAKNTLSFSEVVHEGTVAGSREIVGGNDTLWYGDSVSLDFEDGEKLTITSFEDGVEEVIVILKSSDIEGADAGDIVARLTPQSPTLEEFIVEGDDEDASISSAEFYLAVNNYCRGKKIHYEISGSTLTASSARQDQEGDTITIDSVTHSVDSTTYETHIELDKGDKIELVSRDASGVTVYLAIFNSSTFTGSARLVEMSSSTPCYTAESDNEYVMIVAGSHYTEGFTCTYKIIRAHKSSQDNLIAGTQLTYADPASAYELEVGDVITNTTTGSNLIVLDCINNTILATLAKGASFTCTYPCSVVLCGEDVNTELSYTLQNKEKTYAAEYEGDSGILQLRHAMGARVKVYGDAGAGYMLIHEMEGKEIVRCVNMSGFNSIKLVSDGEVDECIINEF